MSNPIIHKIENVVPKSIKHKTSVYKDEGFVPKI